jgi:uncharacterized membrane protein
MKFKAEVARLLSRGSESQFYLILLLVAASVTTVLMLNLDVDVHQNFLTIACDTAAFQNAIVNTLHGSWFRDTVYDGPNILGLHTTFILLLIAPIYAAFPSVNTLLTLQVCMVYGAVIPLYLVGVEILKKPVSAFVIAGAALASPLLIHMAMSPFHPETWISTTVLWSYFFYFRNNPIGFWVSLAFAVSCGEQAALIYASLGLALLIINDGLAWRKRYALWCITASIGWLLLAMIIIMPLMHTPGQTNLFTYHYSDWNIQSGFELIAVPFRHPIQCLVMLFGLGRWEYIAGMVGLPLFLSLFSRRSLFLLGLFPVYFLMSDQVFFQPYHAYFYQFALLAGYVGLICFISTNAISSRLGAAVMVGTIFINALIFCSAFALYTRLDLGSREDLSARLRNIFENIPKDAGVYCPHRYSEYLSDRQNVVMGDLSDNDLDFQQMIESRFNLTDVHPEQIDYIVCDLLNDQCGWRQNNLNEDMSKRRASNINDLILSGRWQIAYNQNDVVILRRANAR